MSRYREYPSAELLLLGYDPVRDLPQNHLARLVDRVVEEAIPIAPRQPGAGQPPFDPRLCLKVLLYAYSIGIRSSRQMERLCQESLPFLLLTRGDSPSYVTLCTTRNQCKAQLEQVFEALFAVAVESGLPRLGKIVVDSSKFKANASPEAVLRRDDFAVVRQELQQILAEADAKDAQEAVEGGGSETVVAKRVSTDHLRDILRRVRARQAEEKAPEKATEKVEAGQEQEQVARTVDLSPAGSSLENAQNTVVSAAMRKRLVQAVAAIDAAEAEGRKHLCLTDPDARMLGEGRSKQLKECHSFEIAVDNGLIVTCGVTGEQDNSRLAPLVAAAATHEPEGITAVDADCGYFRSDDIAALEASGIVTCIPDVFTACDMRRGLPIGTTREKQFGSMTFTREEPSDSYLCPEGKSLIFLQQRQKNGQTVRIYRAIEPCVGCPRASECLTQATAKRRQLSVGVDKPKVGQILERFQDAAHRQRYHRRAPAVETVFGFLRAVLGFSSWLLRGKEQVSCEASLFAAAYQFRKVQAKRQTKTQPNLSQPMAQTV